MPGVEHEEEALGNGGRKAVHAAVLPMRPLDRKVLTSQATSWPRPISL